MCNSGLWVDVGIVFLAILPILLVFVMPLLGWIFKLGWNPFSLGTVALKQMLGTRISRLYLLFLLNAAALLYYLVSAKSFWDILVDSTLWGALLTSLVSLLGLALLIFAAFASLGGKSSGMGTGFGSIIVWAILLYLFWEIERGAVDNLKATSVENLLCCAGFGTIVDYLKAHSMWKV